MQVLQAGNHKFLFLELESNMVQAVLKKAGYEGKVEDAPRAVTAQVTRPGRQSPLLLFDASDPANLGWFSRCHFYVDGLTGAVLQTPIAVANVRDSRGRVDPSALRLKISKELPVSFRLPGRNPVTEQMIYAVLYNFLSSLAETGVGLCGSNLIHPLIGRMEQTEPRT